MFVQTTIEHLDLKRPGPFKHHCLSLEVSRELLARMPLHITTVQDALFVRNAIQHLEWSQGEHAETLGRLRMERLKWLLETRQCPAEAKELLCAQLGIATEKCA